MQIERRAIVSRAWHVHITTLSIKISEEIVDKLQLGIWRIINKGTNVKEVGRVQTSKVSTCLEADVWGFITHPRSQWQEES